MKTKEKISKARAGLILDQPFFGSLSLKLILKEDITCETAWTDGVSLGYNPAFIDELHLDQVKGLLAHEVMHCACAHNTRRGNRDGKRWNVAADYAINPLLNEAGFVLPPGVLFDFSYKGKSADEIYTLLPASSDGNGGSGKSDPGGCGEVRDNTGKDGKAPTQSETVQAEQDWKIAASQAAQQARVSGQLPAWLDRFVKEVLEPKADWREVLRRFVDQSAKNDYNWAQPNRRYIPQGLYLPSLKSDELPPIVVAVDTSGSISHEIIEQFAGEITGILQEYQTSCTVLYCDTQIAGVEEFGSEDLPIELQPRGGGSTDFRPPFTHIEEHNIQPSCLIYLTDLCCSRYPDEPGYHVLWAHIGDYGRTPPFGEIIKL